MLSKHQATHFPSKPYPQPAALLEIHSFHLLHPLDASSCADGRDRISCRPWRVKACVGWPRRDAGVGRIAGMAGGGACLGSCGSRAILEGPTIFPCSTEQDPVQRETVRTLSHPETGGSLVFPVSFQLFFFLFRRKKKKIRKSLCKVHILKATLPLILARAEHEKTNGWEEGGSSSWHHRRAWHLGGRQTRRTYNWMRKVCIERWCGKEKKDGWTPTRVWVQHAADHDVRVAC